MRNSHIAFACTVLLFLVFCHAQTGLAITAERLIEDSGIMGGLIVHVPAGDGQFTCGLHMNDRFIVQGLECDPATVEKTREAIRAGSVYGPASVEHWTGNDLPYIDNLVNLLVVEDAQAVSRDEILRVLCPDGVALIRRTEGGGQRTEDGEWVIISKPRPEQMDEWTHYLHDPSNNAVAHDTALDFPQHLQWIAGPKWGRQHDHMSSCSAMVSAGGRNFYIFDEGSAVSVQLPSKWSLIARDAFNGKLLWKQPIPKWHTQNVADQQGKGTHLFSPTGFLEDAYWHRFYWVYGRRWASGATSFYQAGWHAPSGRLLVMNEDTLFGFGRKPGYLRWTTALEHQLFSCSRSPEIVKTHAPARKGWIAVQPPPVEVTRHWTRDIPLLTKAMVLADRTLFVAGPRDIVNEDQTLKTFGDLQTQRLLAEQDALLAGRQGALLRAVSTEDGQILAEYPLAASPVWDGMATAGQRLYIALQNGELVCLARNDGLFSASLREKTCF